MRLLQEQLFREAEEMGISLSEPCAQKLLRHLELVLAANNTTNLTRITEPQDAVSLHIVDSLLLLPHLTGPFADLGSGAGYPGIPLGICSSFSAALIESSKRKAECLCEFVKELGLPHLSIAHERVEEHALQCSGKYQNVVARALAPSPILIEYASPLLSLGGRLVSTKGPQEENRTQIDSVLRLCGMIHVSRETCNLPRGMGVRNIDIYEKTGDAEVRLPRRPGMASKRPLA